MYLAQENLRVAVGSRDHAGLVLGDYMLGGGFSDSRFRQRFRADSANVEIESDLTVTLGDGVGEFTVRGTVAPPGLDRLGTAVAEEVGRVAEEGFSAGEVEMAKKEWQQAQRRRLALHDVLMVEFSNQAFLRRTFGDEVSFERRMEGPTAPAVNATMRRHLRPAKLSVVTAVGQPSSH